MLRINLLPIKAARKHDTAKQELMLLGALVGVSLAGLYVFHSTLTSDIKTMRTRINTVQQEIAQLKQDVVRVEEFKKKAQTLEAKIKVIRDLQNQRIGPARMLDDLGTIINQQPKVWLTNLSEKDGVLTLEGGAMEEENLSDFQLALDRRSKLFSGANLLFFNAVKSGNTAYLKWKMTCKANYRAG